MKIIELHNGKIIKFKVWGFEFFPKHWFLNIGFFYQKEVEDESLL